MTRSELIQNVLLQNPALTLIQVEECVTIILDEITHALTLGNRVELRGFGVFSVKKRSSRVGRNPRTGQSVSVNAKSIPFFKTGKNLRERLNLSE